MTWPHTSSTAYMFDVAGRHLNRLLAANPHASQNLHQVCEQGWTEGAGRKIRCARRAGRRKMMMASAVLARLSYPAIIAGILVIYI